MAGVLQSTLAAVENERNKLDTLFLHMTDGVVAFDHEGTVIHCNPAAKTMLHRPSREITNYAELFGSLYPFQDMLALQRPNYAEAQMQVGERALEVYLAPFSDKASGGVLVVLHDVTEQHRNEERRKEFVANVSHELRTPLTNVRSYAETLLFDTMATVFRNMAGGRIWGALFFLFMVFAAFSTELAVCENILACVREMTGWSRKKGSVVCGVGIALISLTTALGFNVLPFHPFGPDSVFLDFWDAIVSTHLLPLGALIFTLYCVSSRLGWGWDAFVAEANAGKGLKVKSWMRPVFTYAVPACIALIYVMGIL